MISKFENPPERNRIHPFWFLNGDIREEELARQVLEMKEKGAGGFVLCARQGLTVPYLSREWFDLCEAAVSCAKREGMEVWLYDEFPYPSGMSGGEVTMLHPEACQHELVFTDSVTEEEKLTVSLGKVRLLSAMAYPVDGERTVWERGRNVADCAGIVQPVRIYQKSRRENALTWKRFFSYDPQRKLVWRNPGGKWRIITAGARKIRDFKYYGDFLDPANPEAVDAFLETTYERYDQRFGELFGSTIKGIFADETHFLGDHFWSFQLPDYYRHRFGRDIVTELAGVWDRDYPDSAGICYRYFQCMHELLRDRYHRKISRWCESRGLRYTAEIPSMRMSGQKYSHIPGGIRTMTRSDCRLRRRWTGIS